MYTLIVGDEVRLTNRSKGEINTAISKMMEGTEFKVVQDVTSQFPTIAEHRIADQRLATIDSLGDLINWGSPVGWDTIEAQRRERYDHLTKQQNEWEYECGY